jgi:hypothetical protein
MVQVEDGEESTDSKLLRLSVYPHDGLTVTTRDLPAAISGQAYSARLEALGGIPPYFFTVRRGVSLPPGLTLDSAGEISGTPAQKDAYDFTLDVVDGNGLQGSATYTMVILGADDKFEFLVKEYESDKRLQLSFYLPRSFDETKILSVEALISPDVYIAGSSSAITKEQDGHRVKLTLQIAENTMNNGENWSTLLEELAIEGITVKFQDASGEEIRFEEALLLKELEREEEPDESGDKSGGGGCNSAWGMSLSSLALIAVLMTNKRKQ